VLLNVLTSHCSKLHVVRSLKIRIHQNVDLTLLTQHVYRAGDLGTTASEVETALERNFSLANRWGSILLLDEADVFLAQRSPKNFIRNGLVAGML
jgi:hypothetical protein